MRTMVILDKLLRVAAQVEVSVDGAIIFHVLYKSANWNKVERRKLLLRESTS